MNGGTDIEGFLRTFFRNVNVQRGRVLLGKLDIHIGLCELLSAGAISITNTDVVYLSSSQIRRSSSSISGASFFSSPRLNGKKSFMPKNDSVNSAKNSIWSVRA